MEDKLRKVSFNLNGQNLNYGDLDYNDSEGIMKERQGEFHRWGDTTTYDSQEQKMFQKTVAIVEEISTGQIYEIAPHCLKFEIE